MSHAPEVRTYLLEDAGDIPNNPHLPLLVYPKAVQLDGRDPAIVFETLYPNGGWYPAWRYSVYPFPHYHSTAHEVLGVYRGSATLRMGHTAGVTLEVEPGDVVIIPAGVGHQNLGSSSDFNVVGGYPEGQEADLMRGRRDERSQADKRIAAVSLPIGDPVFGGQGPLRQHWVHRSPR